MPFSISFSLCFLLNSCESMQAIRAQRHTLHGSVPRQTFSFFKFILWLAVLGAKGTSPKATHTPLLLLCTPSPSPRFSPDTILMHIHQLRFSSLDYRKKKPDTALKMLSVTNIHTWTHPEIPQHTLWLQVPFLLPKKTFTTTPHIVGLLFKVLSFLGFPWWMDWCGKIAS